MKGPAIVCVVSENYLPWARVWSETMRRHVPQVPARVLLCAPEDVCLTVARSGLDIISLGELMTPVLKRMLSHHTQRQFLSAVKPIVLQHLLRQGHSSVLFLDADLMVTGDLDPLLSIVSKHAVTVTPHRLTPPAGGDRLHLLSGMFNAGFLGFSNVPSAISFLDWWASRLETHCFQAPGEGVNFDQRWLDLAPGFVEDLFYLRDPGCNVAYWNLDERTITRDGQDWKAAGKPLRFFHFSGFTPAEPDKVGLHTAGLRVAELGVESALFREYAAMLLAAGWKERNNPHWRWGPSRRLGARVIRWLSRVKRRLNLGTLR